MSLNEFFQSFGLAEVVFNAGRCHPTWSSASASRARPSRLFRRGITSGSAKTSSPRAASADSCAAEDESWCLTQWVEWSLSSLRITAVRVLQHFAHLPLLFALCEVSISRRRKFVAHTKPWRKMRQVPEEVTENVTSFLLVSGENSPGWYED